MPSESQPEELRTFQNELLGAVRCAPVHPFPFPFLSGEIGGPDILRFLARMRESFPRPAPGGSVDAGMGPEEHRAITALKDIPDRAQASFWGEALSSPFSEGLSLALLQKFLPFIPSFRFDLRSRVRRLASSIPRSKFPPLGAAERAALLARPLERTWILTCDRGGYALEPHTDHPRKMITFLLYLSEPGSGESITGTSLYYPLSSRRTSWDSARAPRAEFVEVLRARHLEGRFLAFVKSDLSWHGVEPCARFSHDRLSANLTVLRPAEMGG